MTGVLNAAFLTVFLATAVAQAMPLLLVALGEMFEQQAGVLGIGLEGMLLTGGFFAFATTLATGSFWLGFVAGALAGAILAGVLVLLTIVLHANQIVVGIGIILAGTGMSSMLYESWFGMSLPRLGLPVSWKIPGLSALPIVGESLFAQPSMFFASLGFVLVASWWLRASAAGLRLRAAGQDPTALDAAGGNVTLTRSLAALFAGALAGIAGAYLALLSAGTFTPGMTHGLGFLAIVVAMLSAGKVGRVATLASLYGLLVAAGIALQVTTFSVPSDLVAISPFIAVLVALIVARGRTVLPPALATAYTRGAR